MTSPTDQPSSQSDQFAQEPTEEDEERVERGEWTADRPLRGQERPGFLPLVVTVAALALVFGIFALITLVAFHTS